MLRKNVTFGWNDKTHATAVTLKVIVGCVPIAQPKIRSIHLFVFFCLFVCFQLQSVFRINFLSKLFTKQSINFQTSVHKLFLCLSINYGTWLNDIQFASRISAFIKLTKCHRCFSSISIPFIHIHHALTIACFVYSQRE